jgi:hypothetical protein
MENFMSEINFEALSEHFSGDPQVAEAKWFGKPCLNVNGKAFAVKFGRDVAFKLTGDVHSKALEIEGAKLFDPRGKGKAFKEWVQVPVAQSSSWPELAEEARDFVRSLSK